MAREMKDSGIEWIGEIPVDWNVVKVKKIVKSIDNGVWGDDPIPGIETYKVLRSTEQTVDGQWNISVPAERDLSSIPSLSKYAVQENDLLITKSSGSNDHIGKTTLVTQEIAKQKFFYSNFLGRIRVSERYSSKLLWYILNSSVARSQFVYLQNSTSGLGNINSEMIGNLWLPMMSLTNQNRIASFLDSKCADIDKAIEATKASIEEYRKLRQAIITEAVTKGLDPNVEMKDSGIEWIGEIPANWQVRKMNDVAKVITDFVASGSFGDIAKNVKYLDDPDYAMLVRTADISNKNGTVKPVYVDEHSYNFLSNSNLFGGEILLPNVGAIGDVYIVPTLYKHMTLAPNSVIVRTKFCDKFFYYYFSSDLGKSQINNITSKTAMPKFNKTDFRQMKVLLPGIEEQNRIASFLDTKCSEIDSLIKSKEKLIEELTAYRKSLIYEYVTGKKEVPIESA